MKALPKNLYASHPIRHDTDPTRARKMVPEEARGAARRMRTGPAFRSAPAYLWPSPRPSSARPWACWRAARHPRGQGTSRRTSASWSTDQERAGDVGNDGVVKRRCRHTVDCWPANNRLRVCLCDSGISLSSVVGMCWHCRRARPNPETQATTTLTDCGGSRVVPAQRSGRRFAQGHMGHRDAAVGGARPARDDARLPLAR